VKLEQVLAGVSSLLDDPNGTFIVADIFDKKQVDSMESLFQEYFIIEKKEVITFNVKHAIILGHDRTDKIVSSLSHGYNFLERFFQGFFVSKDTSKTFCELGKTKDYICYVLRPKNQ
jgi:hypothetical protein